MPIRSPRDPRRRLSDPDEVFDIVVSHAVVVLCKWESTFMPSKPSSAVALRSTGKKAGAT